MTSTMETEKQIEIWKSFLDVRDAPEGLAADIQNALATYERSKTLLSQLRVKHGKISQDYFAHIKVASQALFVQLSNNEKHSLPKLSDQNALLGSGRDEAEVQVRIATGAFNKACDPFRGGLRTKYSKALLVWVANRRVIDLTACGYTKNITKESEAIWESLGVLLYGNRQEIFDPVKGLTRLPLVIEPTWSNDARRAVAGMWREIGEGRFMLVKANERATNADRLRFTSYVESLP